jgi:hypothetical protein
MEGGRSIRVVVITPWRHVAASSIASIVLTHLLSYSIPIRVVRVNGSRLHFALLTGLRALRGSGGVACEVKLKRLAQRGALECRADEIGA